MGSSDQNGAVYVSQVGSMEDDLSAKLAMTVDEVARTECFDSEQRAEVYTILETLKSNTETHRAMLKLLAGKMKAKRPDA
ncbi:MAG: hypothetical protein ACYSTL_02300 [Planctomycetota bacterium]|jgi:hypothetical protein